MNSQNSPICGICSVVTKLAVHGFSPWGWVDFASELGTFCQPCERRLWETGVLRSGCAVSRRQLLGVHSIREDTPTIFKVAQGVIAGIAKGRQLRNPRRKYGYDFSQHDTKPGNYKNSRFQNFCRTRSPHTNSEAGKRRWGHVLANG